MAPVVVEDIREEGEEVGPGVAVGMRLYDQDRIPKPTSTILRAQLVGMDSHNIKASGNGRGRARVSRDDEPSSMPRRYPRVPVVFRKGQRFRSHLSPRLPMGLVPPQVAWRRWEAWVRTGGDPWVCIEQIVIESFLANCKYVQTVSSCLACWLGLQSASYSITKPFHRPAA